jgi:hypothetical protein
MVTRRRRGDETLNRLLNWSDGQKASERLAGHILAHEGYKSIDPSHPLGGPDGLKDIICEKNGDYWVAASYFGNGKKTFKKIHEKFMHDIGILKTEKVNGFIFVTNQSLSLNERKKLKLGDNSAHLDIFHLERLTHILNCPENYGIRLEFLDIEMNKEEQISYFTTIAKQSIAEWNNIQKSFEETLRKMQQLLPEQGEKNE